MSYGPELKKDLMEISGDLKRYIRLLVDWNQQISAQFQDTKFENHSNLKVVKGLLAQGIQFQVNQLAE